MSDFIYANTPQEASALTACLHSIYKGEPPEVHEYHGEWGSLAVSRNLYNGLQPLETLQHIFLVIGGPVLYFRDNQFLTGDAPVAGTKAIYERWLSGDMQWDEDLSGPFVVLVVDKVENRVVLVTDLMSFIPVYRYCQDDKLVFGTHVDALAKASGQSSDPDTLSLVDFVLNGVVTYPHTVYKNIFQCPPATVATYNSNVEQEIDTYWLPKETIDYKNIDDAARALREGLQDYVQRTTEGMKEVAQFISAGEDSRALSGLLPRRLKRDAFTFLDCMNREGKIAHRVAGAYGASFHAGIRSRSYYLDILEEASDLIGSGHQYIHAHTLGFATRYGLEHYPAVFGGYLSDSLLKGAYASKVGGRERFPFVPEFFRPGESRSKPVVNRVFSDETLEGITRRRRDHLRYVQSIRPTTANEWFVLWPVTMRVAIPNLYSNRRLFRSYEPFMANEVVKISAAVPIAWKLNRRLFSKAVRPFLRPSKWLLHADGRLPYFPWWVNAPFQFGIWFSRQVGKRIGLVRGHHGPWGDWSQVTKGVEWRERVERCGAGLAFLGSSMRETEVQQLFNGSQLSRAQKNNLMQVLYSLLKTRPIQASAMLTRIGAPRFTHCDVDQRPAANTNMMDRNCLDPLAPSNRLYKAARLTDELFKGVEVEL
jgi:hypothetical protein